MTALAAHGISIDLPTTWEGRIGLRARPAASYTAARVGASGVSGAAGAGGAAIAGAVEQPADGADGWAGEQAFPISHVANFALPATRGDFGSGAVDLMGEAGVLMALVEYDPRDAGSRLFDRARPTPRIAEFSPDTLQRKIYGQLGYQQFFTEAGRAFCLYVVVGSIRFAPTLLTQTRAVLAGTSIEARR